MEWVRGRGLEGRRCREEVWRLMGDGRLLGLDVGVLKSLKVSKGQLFIPSHPRSLSTEVKSQDMGIMT